ncbi:MAG: NADH-quinone oxidoreductase subunit L [Candidatus Eisenbacteria bacterium]
MMSPASIALFLPLASFAILTLVKPLRKSGAPAGIFSSLMALGSLAASLMALFGRAPHDPAQVSVVPWLVSGGKVMAELGIRLDGISASMAVVVALVASCVQIYSLGYLHEEPKGSLGRYYTWQSLFLFSMLALVLAPNLLTLFLAWELVGLCSYLLIGFWWTKPSAAKAAIKAFWVTKFADMGFLVGLMILYAATGGFGWDQHLSGSVAVAVAALLFIGVMGKSAQVPLHIWLPDAMEGPTPVSALLHAATMVAAGVYMIVRVYPIFEAAPSVLTVMAWIGSLTAFLAACIAVVQNDIKKVLAYSTCSQLGYMVAALGSGSMMGGYFHLTTHAFFKALLFLGAGAAIHAVGSNSIFDMGGLRKKTPISAGLFIVGALALAGIPVFAGFFSKDLILEELLHAGLIGPLVLCLAGAALTAFYMTRVILIAYFGQPSEHLKKHGSHAHEAPASMLVPMLALGVLTVVGGFLAHWFAESWHEEYHFAISPVGLAAFGLAAAGIVVGVLRYGTRTMAAPAALAPIRTLILSGPFDRFWAFAYRRGLLVISAASGWFDRYVVDGLMNYIGWAAISIGSFVRRFQTGRAPDYVMAVLVGMLLLIAYGMLRS